jgi:pimeloyl-ACP methyl ester carboxylesterase
VIEPFFLSGDGPDLFLTYHPPSGAFASEITVICSPFFSEFHRSQLALRELAIALSAAGQHVFRFDYRGSGDSFGEAESLAAWAADLNRVIEEARDITGAAALNLVAVRAATLLLHDALERSSVTGRVVLWDPVWRGEPYLTSLLQIRDEAVFRNRWLSGAGRRLIKDELFGFPLSPQLAGDIRLADTWGQLSGASHSVTAVCTVSAESQPDGVSVRPVTYDCQWLHSSEDVLMPKPVLEEISECVLTS